MALVGWSKLALAKSCTQEIKMFAQMMIDGHTKATEALRAVVQSSRGLIIPTDLPDAQKQDLSAAGVLSDPLFYRRYKGVMIRVHEKVATAVRAYADNGENADLRQWAQVNLPVLREYLQKAQSLAGEL
jgi:putative membrane protein